MALWPFCNSHQFIQFTYIYWILSLCQAQSQGLEKQQMTRQSCDHSGAQCGAHKQRGILRSGCTCTAFSSCPAPPLPSPSYYAHVNQTHSSNFHTTKIAIHLTEWIDIHCILIHMGKMYLFQWLNSPVWNVSGKLKTLHHDCGKESNFKITSSCMLKRKDISVVTNWKNVTILH